MLRSALVEHPDIVCCGEIFNVGAPNANYRVKEVAHLVGETFSGCDVEFGPPSGDNRSYRVNFDKIQAQLPGFSCDWSLEQGVQELHQIFQRIQLTSNEFESRHFTRLKALTYLLETEQLDQDFFWK